ncbi:hypothetical protein [Streptomyces natalensis]|nr:hypothetical protein [Streptomyces natalensis]
MDTPFVVLEPSAPEPSTVHIRRPVSALPPDDRARPTPGSPSPPHHSL